MLKSLSLEMAFLGLCLLLLATIGLAQFDLGHLNDALGYTFAILKTLLILAVFMRGL